jgi:hypothetical protein
MSGHRVQITVFLEPNVHQAAKQRAGEMKLSLSATVAEAAKESLLSSYRSERETEILKATERNLYALRRLDQRMRIELQVLKELIGLGMRSFFNHIPPVPESGKTAALLSGKQRFQRYLDLVAANLRGGDSILAGVPLPEPVAIPADEHSADGATATPQASGQASGQPSATVETPNDRREARTASIAPSPHKLARGQTHDQEIGLFESTKPKETVKQKESHAT